MRGRLLGKNGRWQQRRFTDESCRLDGAVDFRGCTYVDKTGKRATNHGTEYKLKYAERHFLHFDPPRLTLRYGWLTMRLIKGDKNRFASTVEKDLTGWVHVESDVCCLQGKGGAAHWPRTQKTIAR